MTYNGCIWCKIWYQIWSNPSKHLSGTINILQVWLCSWCTYNHARELENLNTTQEWKSILIHDVKFDIRDDPILQNFSHESSMSSKYDCVLRVFFNCARGLKIWIQPRNDKLYWFMMSNLISKIQSPKTLDRNNQHSPSMTVFFMHIQSW